MNVFADLHQDDLYYSLHLLFEKRLGFKLYRPTGHEWAEKGYWKYSDNKDTQKQYLDIPKEAELKDDHYKIHETKHKYKHNALTLDQFRDMDIDIIIGSVNQHEKAFLDLKTKEKPNAKFIRQVGNVHDGVDTSICKNLLVSTAPRVFPSDVNTIFYHQEFELSTFDYKEPYNKKNITNLMNCVPDSVDYPVYKKYKELLKEYNWKMYGILGHDGIIGTDKGVAKAIQDSTFVWHLKAQGDGFGHVIHNAFACGRPPIVRKSYYQNELAGALMEDTTTCIDLEARTPNENVEMIKALSEPETHKRMSKNTYNRFKECVDFDFEYKEIIKFLARLK